MFSCPFCSASFKHNGLCLRKHIAACSLISSPSDVSNSPIKLPCPHCPKKIVSQKTLDTHHRKFHPVQLSDLLADSDQSIDSLLI